MAGGGREWLLLADAAQRTGLSVDALRKRAQRSRLESRKGNDGLVRVFVSADDLAAIRPHSPTVQTTAGQPADSPLGQDAAREAIAVLERQLLAVRNDLETAVQNATVEREKLTQERQSIFSDFRQSQIQLSNVLKSEGDARAERDCLRVEKETGERLAAERHQAAQEKISELREQLAEATRPRSFWERLFLR